MPLDDAVLDYQVTGETDVGGTPTADRGRGRGPPLDDRGPAGRRAAGRPEAGERRPRRVRARADARLRAAVGRPCPRLLPPRRGHQPRACGRDLGGLHPRAVDPPERRRRAGRVGAGRRDPPLDRLQRRAGRLEAGERAGDLRSRAHASRGSPRRSRRRHIFRPSWPSRSALLEAAALSGRRRSRCDTRSPPGWRWGRRREARQPHSRVRPRRAGKRAPSPAVRTSCWVCSRACC